MRSWVVALVVTFTAVAVPVFTAKPVTVHVDDDAAAGGDGSGRFPYNNLPDAVAAAGAFSQAVVIRVAPGNYSLAAPLVIDRSLELRGSTRQVDREGDRWPSGEVVPDTETRVFATSAIGSQPLVQVGHVDGTVLNDVTIRGLMFEGTATGSEMLLTRVQGFWVADNVFRAPANFAFVSVASTGRLTRNHFSGVGTGAIFNGGYPESPSTVVATGNRAVHNTIGGILLNGASINIPELGDELDAVVRDNDLSDHVGIQGFGLRLFIIRRDPNAEGNSQSSARIYARAQDNRISGNRVGVLIDAGFPHRFFQGVCDPRVYSGGVDLELRGNTVTHSLATPALITLTRSLAALNPSMLSQFQYLHNATFVISDPDGTLESAWIDHPSTDPFIGSCFGDGTQESLGNTVIYNGALLPNGRNF
jgi:hypothetical protein